MSRILCCGDRDWRDWDTIRKVLRPLPKETVIIEGENGVVDKFGRIERGADKMCAKVARELQLEVLPFPAEWTKYGKGAGPIRNKKMLDDGKPDRVIAFHPNIKKSKGTANMVRQATAAGLPVRVIVGICTECAGTGLDHPASYKSRNTDDDSCPVCGGLGVV